jgi:dipeptidase
MNLEYPSGIDKINSLHLMDVKPEYPKAISEIELFGVS